MKYLSFIMNLLTLILMPDGSFDWNEYISLLGIVNFFLDNWYSKDEKKKDDDEKNEIPPSDK